MRLLVLITVFLSGFSIYAQTIRQQVEKIKTVVDAEEYIETHPAQLLAISSADKLSLFEKTLFSRRLGEIAVFENDIYKVLESRTALSFRASYIYLNASKISRPTIDSLRGVILSEYKKGTSFIELAKKYTMDSSPGGDLGWFGEGSMVKEFEAAVRQHKKNDIFLVDVPANKWYYVALKTFDDRNITTLIVLKVKNTK